MNYLDMLDNKPVALPNKPVNIQLQKQVPKSQKTLMEIEAEKNPEKKLKSIAVNIVDSRAKKGSSVNREELKELLKSHSLSKTTNTILDTPSASAAPLPPTVTTDPTKAVKVPGKLSVIEEEEEPLAEDQGDQGDQDQDQQGEQEAIEEAEVAAEPIVEVPIATKEKKKRQKKEEAVVDTSNLPLVKIGKVSLRDRLKTPQPSVNIKVSSYYMNNREMFVKFINKMFQPYKNELMSDTSNITCDNIGKTTGDFDLLTHQKIVRDYLNLYTPYRGLLLYHGLGSGKTCTSIAIAEGIKTAQNVVIMTPASLRTNYMEELKKCGDYLYKRQQFWEWVPSDNKIEVENTLSKVLNYPITDVKKNGGAWLVNVSKPSNYDTLDNNQKKSLNEQINKMIEQKYQFINYNGLNRNLLESLTANHSFNLFDNKVVIIDEAHNFISRIVNKINKEYKNKTSQAGKDLSEPVPEYYLFPRSEKKAKDAKALESAKPKPRNEEEPRPRYKHVSVALYDYLLNAKNVKIVLLTGTPIINYPNEIAILYNILRGYIKTFSMSLDIETQTTIDKDSLMQIFAHEKILDTLDYVPRNNQLVITRNPFGFKSVIYSKDGYVGVSNEPSETKEGIVVPGQVTDAQFIENIKRILKRHNVSFNLDNVKVTYYKALPDKLYEFSEWFMESSSQVKKMDEFKRRIIGLTSYFRSAQEELMPRYDPNFEPVEIEMSDFQFNVYENMREEERKIELNAKKNSTKKKPDVTDVYDEPKSTFKIFSRMFCNFTIPLPPGRPTPKNISEFINDKIVEQHRESEAYRPAREEIEAIRSYERTEEGKAEAIARQAEAAQKVAAEKQAKADKVHQRIARADAKKQELSAKEAKALAKANEKEAKALEKAAKEAEKAKKKEEKEKETLAKALAKPKKTRKKPPSPTQPSKTNKKTKKILTKLKVVESSSSSDSDSDSSSDSDSDEKSKPKPKSKTKTNQIKDVGKLMELDEFSQAGGEGDSDANDDDEEVREIAGVRAEIGADPKQPAQLSSDKLENFIDRMDNIQDDQDMEEELDIDELMMAAADSGSRKKKQGIVMNYELNTKPTATVVSDMYKRQIASVLTFLREHNELFSLNGYNGLRKYSPKFARMIENIINPDHIGLNLVYSQFRTLEGIGIFAIALEANGFAQFKIKRTALTWEINMSEDEWAKPHYAMYTGTEDTEEKEIIRKIYNGDWDQIPSNIASKLRERNHNNNVGEIIKVFMITASGSEGINLRNTRYVHIMEPYWNPVRAEQVIGRARRICSHQGLPEELQTVEVFLYLMVFSQAQIDRASRELKLNDVSKVNKISGGKLTKDIVFTSEQTLHEISSIKKSFTNQIMRAIKEASIDCAIHSKGNAKEGIQCVDFGSPDIHERSFMPDIFEDEKGNVAIAKQAFTKKAVLWEPQDITIKGVKYIKRVGTDEIYDYESYINAKTNNELENPQAGVEPLLVGNLTKKDGVTKFKLLKK